jgi:hypothetical protein
LCAIVVIAAKCGIVTGTAVAQSIPINWISEGTFDVSTVPATAVNTFSSSGALGIQDVFAILSLLLLFAAMLLRRGTVQAVWERSGAVIRTAGRGIAC